MFRTIHAVVAPLQSTHTLDKLGVGEAIAWPLLLRSFLVRVVLYSGALAWIGSWLFSTSRDWSSPVRKLLVSLLIAAVALGMLFLSGRCHPTLLAQRQHLTPGAADALDNSPPLVAFTTVALGGFRGILADVLWLRAIRMQEEGNYFELVQLVRLDHQTRAQVHTRMGLSRLEHGLQRQRAVQ